jgi:hypothetical protein
LQGPLKRGNASDVRCPRCRELAPEGAAICDNCNEILDSSFLDGADEVTPVDGEKTDVGANPTAPGPKNAQFVQNSRMPDRLRKTHANTGGWNPGPAGVGEGPENRPYLAPEQPEAPPGPIEEAQKAAADLNSFFRSLSLADRWAAGATSGMLLLLALPWRWDKDDDEIIGIVSAWPLLFLGGTVLLLVYLRARRADAALDRRLRFVQIAASLTCAAYVGGYLRWASRSHAVRVVGQQLAVISSTPQASAYAGLVCAIAGLLASATLLKRDN